MKLYFIELFSDADILLRISDYRYEFFSIAI